MKAEKTRMFLEDLSDPECECVSCNKTREKLNELTELERIVTEYESPETQQNIELGKAVKLAFKRFGVLDCGDQHDGAIFEDVKEFYEWYKEETL